MISSSLDSLAPTGRLFIEGDPSQRATAQEEFAALLARSRSGATPAGSIREQAREAAEQFVALTLIQPILKQLRETNQAAPPFAPGAGEKQFQSLFDGQISHRLARATKFPLVDRLTDDMVRRLEGGGTDLAEVART